MSSSRSIMAKLIQICPALVLFLLICGASEARSVNLGQAEGGPKPPKPNMVCEACLDFSQEAQMILSDPDTEKQAVDLISGMACQSLTPRLNKKCVDMVNVYVPDAIRALQAYVRPELCTEMGLCIPESTHSSPKARGKRMDLAHAMDHFVDDAKTCPLCLDLANDSLNYLALRETKASIMVALHQACSRLEGISRECDLLVDIYAPDVLKHLVNVTPEELCERTHACKPTHKPAALANAGVKRNDCAICQFVVLELKVKLRDPATQDKVLEVLLNGCNRVQNHVDECKLIVAQYAPFILANLDTILDADTLCRRVGVCSTRKVEAVEPVLALFSEGHGHGHGHGHGSLHAF